MNTTISMVPRRGAQRIFLGILLSCCLVLMLSGAGSPVSGDPVQTRSDAAGAARSFSLKYEESSSILTRLDLGQQDVRFRKEPEFGKNDKIVRQALRIGPDAGDFVGFAVNLTRRMLYLDLNRNLDLTDDPQGVYHSAPVAGGNAPIPFAFFKGVRLALRDNGGERPYLLEPFYFLNETTGYIGIRSCYRGVVELGGRQWLFQVQDNLDGRFDANDKFMVAPVPGRMEPKGIPYGAMPLPRRLFLGGSEYQLGIALDSASGYKTATATFVECSSPMSELALEARFARRLVLIQADERLVILDNPEGKIRLPAGDYRIQASYLQAAGGKPILIGSTGKSHFSAAAGAVTGVRVGAPFTSSVAAERKGNILLLSYALRGAAGEVYALSNPDRGNPPKFVIYRGDREVARGDFRFG